MNRPRYPEYKSSGVEWLGEVPGHWEVKRLKYCATCNDDVLPGSTPLDYRIRYVDISSVSLEQGIEKVEEYDFDDAPSRARRRVRDGDTILSTVRSYLKAVARIEKPDDTLIVSTGFAVIRPGEALDSRFLSYLLRSDGFVGEVVANSVGVSYPAINASQVMGFVSLIPPIEEQRAIAAFLDRETARIDALIEKKRRFIELLQEKRAALISRAVTHGLDPNVPLKDSGVEWLGQIPAHWEVKRLKFELVRIEQGWSPLCENTPADENQWGVLKVGCVNGDAFDEAESKTLPDDIEPLTEYEIKVGDVLISRANTRELLGSAALVKSVRPRLLLCDKLYRLRLQSWLDAAYLVYALRSVIARFQYERDSTGASGSMQNIGQDTVKELVLAFPPKEEQLSIAGALDRENVRIELLRNKVESAIEKLKEYRAALIAVAVAGKIDVREV